MKNVAMTAKDKGKLSEMEAAIRQHPESAGEFLDYAYGLGYCEGAIQSAQNILDKLPSSEPQHGEEPK